MSRPIAHTAVWSCTRHRSKALKVVPYRPERILVRAPETGEYVPMRDPVNITGPMGPGVFDLALNFRVVTDLDYAPGKYTGTFIFTCAADP